MKKILSFLTIAAVALGMVSCNDEQLKQFKVEIDDLSCEAVTFEIETSDPNLRYVAGVDYKNTFFHIRESSMEALANFQERIGKSEMTIDGLLIPETEYVWYAICIDENGDQIGDVEYMSFKTPSIKEHAPEWEEGYENLVEHLVGNVYVPETEDVPFNSCAIVANCARNTEAVEAIFGFFGKDLVSSFKTEDLARSFCFENPSIRYSQVSLEPATAWIYKADIKSSYDKENDQYIFEGFVTLYCPFIFFEEEDGEPFGAKIPLKAICKKVVGEPNYKEK